MFVRSVQIREMKEKTAIHMKKNAVKQSVNIHHIREAEHIPKLARKPGSKSPKSGLL
jgi:hypothetical protein